ncbi:site-specific DNA-methyltransferase [Microbacterium lacticum]|uniref:site-specific DNA-methyltransferase n=1 Tax=Microbacterium lacticum TaxID=33885 RepID=UPI00242D9BCA|nr:site-specific DNA-methyltransferase [Microbacterium lacticum]
MARPRQPKGPTQVTAYDHDDKRSNIPTADAAATFYDESKEALPPLRYPRNVDLDPQLVWRGKDAQDGEDLIVDAPPIYIQEKIAPQALIENLKKQSSGRPSDEIPSLFDFDDFDELKGLENVEFYQHEESWKNRMILGDSLQVMGSLAEREALRGKVQMIYIDPPYGIKFGSNWQVRASKRDVRDGRVDDAAREAEQIKAFRDTWELGIHSYLSYLRDRLVSARDLLTESGCVFVQIGDENVHLVRSLLDEVFGSDNFVSQIAFKTTAGRGSNFLAASSNYLLWFAKDLNKLKYREIYDSKNVGDDSASLYSRVLLVDGSYRSMTAAERADPSQLPPGARLFRPDNLVSQRPPQAGDLREFEYQGKRYTPGKGVFKTDKRGLDRLAAARRLWPTSRGTLQYIRFLDDFPAMAMSNVWTDTGTGSFTEDKLYVVQTNTKIVQRCILMTTDPGDLVVDPTCGSGTTATVAEQWGRRWITIDTSRVALALARQRIMGAKYPYYTLADSNNGRMVEGLPPAATTDDVRHGFVYKKIRHVMLKSIANNPDVKDGMTRIEVDEAILRHADFELLYDQPLEDKSKVRVAGPFTVESLSPHRSVSFDDADGLRPGANDAETPSFEQSILADLRAAGIQNGRRSERLVFEAIETYPGAYVQAIGVQEESGERLAIALGPQYGTVSASFIKNAAREAIDVGARLVAVLGFAFDPQLGVETDEEGFAVVAGVRDLGRVKVLVVRMNVDLLMGEELKKNGKGNLFTVFGEPDLALRAVGSQWELEVRGVDVYDPTSGEVRSNSTSEIALWMVDTDYDGESFFVRHAYFLGDNDPYKSLKTALKADIDPDVWATLNRPVSVPFDTPSTGKIAVKVINDYGDEVMKVLEVR